METYTWEVLPKALKSLSVVEQVTKEYEWTLNALSNAAWQNESFPLPWMSMARGANLPTVWTNVIAAWAINAGNGTFGSMDAGMDGYVLFDPPPFCIS
jgi:hypothetical protein